MEGKRGGGEITKKKRKEKRKAKEQARTTERKNRRINRDSFLRRFFP